MERYGGHDATIFVFDKRGNLILLDDISIANYFDASEEVYEYLVNWATRTGEDIPSGLLEIGPFERIQILFRISSNIILLRNKGETSGEEIVAYVIGVQKYGEKLHVMVNEKIELGNLLLSLTELYKVPIITFSDNKDLLSKLAAVLK